MVRSETCYFCFIVVASYLVSCAYAQPHYCFVTVSYPFLIFVCCALRIFDIYPHIYRNIASGVPRNFFVGGGSTNSVEDRGQREWGSGGGSTLVRGSGGSCNLVQEISFRIVKFS